MGTQSQDKYPNILYDKVTESAANTLTFKELNIGLSLFDKVGILIHQIHWYNFQTLLAAAGDTIQFGLSQSNSWAAPNADESSIIVLHEETIKDYGTAGNNQIWRQPQVDDYSTLPGGGILVAPKPLYLFAKGSALANPSAPQARIFFTVMKLKPEEYFELLESRQYFS